LTSTTIGIVSITTGRGSFLIGPASAFGSGTRDLVIRERPRIQSILVQFVSLPGTVDQLRPHMRRWGLSHSHSVLNERERMREALLKAISSGQLLISVAPDVTRGFSVPHAVIARKTTSAAKAQALAAQPHLPVDLEDRLIIVMQMVPDYMSGATKAAFVRTLEDVGVGMIVGGLMAWIGAHFIPGINIAMLAFDLFFLGSDVIRACETIGTQIDAIRKAKSREDFKPAAQAIAGAIAVMLVKGVFNRLLRAKSAPKAASKKTTHAIDEKPNMGGDKAPKREAQRPKSDKDAGGAGNSKRKPEEMAAPPLTPSQRVKGVSSIASVDTPRNKSVFYSGPGNRNKALASTKDGFVPIDGTDCGKQLSKENLYDEFHPLHAEADSHWSMASKRYAEGASGDVTAYVQGASPNRVFAQTELPILLQNEKVETINGIPRKLLQRLENENPGAPFLAVTGQAPQ
jgi:hypothetical protein